LLPCIKQEAQAYTHASRALVNSAAAGRHPGGAGQEGSNSVQSNFTEQQLPRQNASDHHGYRSTMPSPSSSWDLVACIPLPHPLLAMSWTLQVSTL